MKYFAVLFTTLVLVLFQNCSSPKLDSKLESSNPTSDSESIADQPEKDVPTVWPPTNGLPLEGFALTGAPESASGAQWTYKIKDPETSIEYDLKGNLFKPIGTGSFPGLILSHGYGGTPRTNNSTLWRSWGLVVIGVQYTHAPDDQGQPSGGNGGASQANILRARKAMQILASLGYVDMSRLAAHGHSMGAMLTTALVGSYSADFLVASHTAGGIDETGHEKAATPLSLAQKIKRPYQIHHGTEDMIVPLLYDENFVAALQNNEVEHEFHIYSGIDHTKMKMDVTMYDRVRAWYTKHGLFNQ